ncbi:hypothetical protein Tsp_06261 [Trichinella spiralis]|uniref:hypothetical protein n=1 Tax=Trichinella spiralis TaxID=6334 RepID=UPI0001EFBAE5|nr:hypothetical protein Tsp_06261 [Trichinella spiralis]
MAIIQMFNKPGRARRMSTPIHTHCRVHHADLFVFTAGRPCNFVVAVTQPTAVVEGDVVVEESGGQEQAAASEIGALSEEPQKKRKKNTERRKEKLLEAVVLLLLLVMARVKRQRQFPVRLSASSLMLEPVPNTSV